MKNRQLKSKNKIVVGAKIRQLQEDKRKREEEEEKRLKEEEEIRKREEEEEKIRLKDIKEKAKLQKQLHLENVKEKEKETKIQIACEKYGYIPNIIKKDIKVEYKKEVIINNVKNECDEPKSDIILPKDNLRSPIVCVLGHVDAGKTHLLDKIRSSVVYMGEAGNITQQIGASYVPIDNCKVKGLIFIDTPGHEPFVNMRSRGSSLCDIAILVVDILIGIQKQTLECIKLLIDSKKLFVIALNKVDLLYGWKVYKDESIINSLKNQDKNVLMEFNNRVKTIWTQFQELGHNTELYYKNENNAINMVPISAITGEGLSDLLMLLAQIEFIKNDIVDCTVLEVNNVVGRGMTMDVILKNGSLSIGDKIMVCGIKDEPIITYIKALITHNYSNRKGEYINTNKVDASMTCKIDAPHLDDAVAGSSLFVIKEDGDVEKYKIEVMRSLNNLKNKTNLEQGVYVNASSLGAMEALFEYLNDCKVSIGGFRIGNVHKKDVIKAVNEKILLAFDVDIDDDVRKYAKELGVKIFENKIIYKLFDSFSEYIKEVRKIENDLKNNKTVFPCICKILPDCIFNKKSPIVIGVHVYKGILKKGTPLSIFVGEERKELKIGVIDNIEKNHKKIDEAVAGDDVCISIIQKDGEQHYSYGKQFNEKNRLYSRITRESIDNLKMLYPDIVSKKDIFNLIMKLKKVFGII